MGTLRTLTILTALGVWGASAMAAPFQAPAGSTRPPLPDGVQPGQYVQAVVKLYQDGDTEKAGVYAKTAALYKDLLSTEDSATLDKYQSMLDQVKAPAAGAAPGGPIGSDPSQPQPASRGGTMDSKQKARWLLQQAHEQIRLGNLDDATARVAEAQSMNVRWGLFDDTPAKIGEQIRKLRAAAPPAVAAAAAGPDGAAPGVKGDKRAAKARLKDARKLLSGGQYDKAEAVAAEVNGWNLNYGMFEDTPSKVLAASRAVQQRDAIRRIGPKGQPSQEIYDLKVREARAALAAGNLDDAEGKARVAQRMNVVPALNADRPEAVLHDIAMARSRGMNPVAAASAPDGAVVQAQAPADAAPAPAADPFPTTAAVAPGADAAAPAPDAAAPAPGGPNKLDQARALLAAGNFADARALAQQAKAEGADGAFADELVAQIGLAEQAGSLKVYEASLDSLRKGDYDHARDLLNKLSTADLDESTMQKVQDLLARLPKEGAGKAAVGLPVDDAAAVNAQRVNAEVGTRVAEARRMMETDPEKAIELLNKTLASVKAAGLTEPVTRTMTRRVEVAIELAKKDKVNFDAKMKDREYRVEIERKRLRILEADKAKKDRIKSLMEKAQAAYAEGKYEEAEGLARTAGEIDPMDVGPVALATVARYKRRYEADLAIKADKDESAVQMLQSVDRAAVVPTPLNGKGIAFDPSFKSLSESRLRSNERLQPKKDAKTLQYQAKLEEPVSVNFKKQPLSEAVSFLSSYTGMNVVLDPTALAEAGLVDSSPVDLTVKDVKLKSALQLMLRPLGLTYAFRNEVLLITSPQVNRADLVTRYHYVGDLVLAPKSPNNVTSNMAMGNTLPGADPAVMKAQAQAVAGSASTPASTPGDRPIVTESDFAPLINLIKETIAPNTWRVGEGRGDKGGFGMGAGFGGGGGGSDDEPAAVGSITPFFLNISLIIRHTPEVHDEIVDLLRQLRRLQDLQVSIEVRFITVSDSFFEQIGIDFDFAIESNSIHKKTSFAGYLPGAGNLFNPTTATTTTTTGTNTGTSPYVNVNPVLDGSLGAKVPVTVGLGSEGNAQLAGRQSSNLAIPFNQGSSSLIAPFNSQPTGGGSFGIAFLSDLEVYLFITAAQGDTRSNLVQAPKVTTFNGAQASIVSANVINYIQSLLPIVGAGAVAFQPTPGQLLDGVFLNVTPVVSADRRYVRMSLAPNFNTFTGFTTLTVPAAVGGGGLGGTGTSVNGTIQLPQFTNNNVNTTVTVPDGGTVLLGGVKRLREERNEFGVPILSKTPLINRLFRNVGIGRTTDSLMLMVTPRIIILEEEEEQLGIPAVNNNL